MKACVAIGVDRVAQIPALAELRDAADGAERFHKWAIAEGYESELLTDRKGSVTTTAILGKIAAFVERGPELLIVYFAGHGILKAADWEQWLLSEAASNVNEAVNFEATVAIARLAQIPHLVFISDACRALSADDILSQVSGSVVFPPRRRQRGQLQPQVDLFYATAPGDTSLEVPAAQANGDYRALFTGVLLDGLSAMDASVIETVDDPTGKIRVVSSRTLAPYLEREVPRQAIKVNITLNQTPDIRPLSRPPKYLAVVKSTDLEPEFPPAPPPGPPTPPAPSAKLERLAAEHGFGYYFQPEVFAVRAPGPSGDERFDDDMARLMDARGRPSFETRTGFTVIGTSVVEAIFNGQPVASSDVFEEPGTQGINIRLDREGPARSILLQFGSATGTCLAVLPQFVGTVVVEGGRVVSVNYTMARSHPRYMEYEQSRDEVDRRRAFAAVAARRGYLRVEPDKVRQFSGYVRDLKTFDPTLGLYAAYSYAQGGLLDEVDDVFAYMTREEGVPILFDVALLANRMEWMALTLSPPMIAPFCPLLTQGWPYLASAEYVVPEIRQLASHLVPGLWTTFTLNGVYILRDLMTRVGLR